MSTLVFHASSVADTQRLGEALARVLPDGVVVALDGTLGAGKTQLVRSLARACGVPAEAVVSPTFVLVQEYIGRRTLYHIDAYRLRDEDEFLELGPEEYFQGPGITLIEWASRVAGCLPRDRLSIEIVVTGPESRVFRLAGDSSLLEPLAALLGPAATLAD